ncbi:MAG TPA: CAP domain-containing protein, partial [Methyloceanibacter sp.]
MNRNLIALMFGVAGALQMTAADAQQFLVPASAKAEIIAETNAYRKGNGLPPLRESESASRVAQAYAHYLAETNKTGHRADGRDPVQRLRAAKVSFCKFRGENWHASWTRRDKASPDTAMKSALRFWKKSPGHERALRS